MGHEMREPTRSEDLIGISSGTSVTATGSDVTKVLRSVSTRLLDVEVTIR